MKGIENICQYEGSRFFIYLAVAVLISVVCALSLSAISDDSHADNNVKFYVGDIGYRIIGDGQVEVADSDLGLREFIGEDTVQHEGKTYKVVAIGDRAFHDCWRLKTVKIPNSIKTIGKNAFIGATVTNLIMPVSSGFVKYIKDENPFKDCNGIETITFTLGDGIGFDYTDPPICTLDARDYRYTPMYLCRYTLKTVTFEEGITHIGNYSLCKCWKVTSVTLPNSLVSIGEGAFKDCEVLESLTIPAGVQEIGKYAFENCPAYKPVLLNDLNSEVPTIELIRENISRVCVKA